MTTLNDLPPAVLVTIFNFALEEPPGARLSVLELVCRYWRDTICGASCSAIWRKICRDRYPGSGAVTRKEYHSLCQPMVQSAARIIQRTLCRWKAAKDYGLLSTDIWPAVCSVCGVRVSYGDGCEVIHCPFRSFRNAQSKMFVCSHCGTRRPDRAMSVSYSPTRRELLRACFHCKGPFHGWL